MMDIITIDNEGRPVATVPGLYDREFQTDRWAKPWTPIPERKTATARWARAVLIITALSTLSWIVLLLLVIAAVSYL